MITRLPIPRLRPFVSQLWASDAAPAAPRADREHVLPTGSMHLVFRLTDAPLRLFDAAHDGRGHTVGPAIVGGARCTYYIRDISAPAGSIGAMLRPGAAQLLFGAPADELAHRHWNLDDLWGRHAAVAHMQLLEAADAQQRLAVLEAILASRLPLVRGLHPAVACALEHFDTPSTVQAVVRETGYSHRHFNALFARSVGLNPKAYVRVQRFRKALERIDVGRSSALAALALDAGYSDQAHFNREFLAFTGLTPGAYRASAPAFASHVALEPASRRSA